MEKIRSKRPSAQRKYRDSQKHKGLVRYELQISRESKERFESLVETAANEYDESWNLRHRMAKARSDIFDEITQGITRDFYALKNQINVLKAEIKALSPSFFKKMLPENSPLPQSIQSLPDDPVQLKKILASTHLEAQHAKKEMLKYQRQAQQYLSLYETASSYNDELQAQVQASQEIR